MATPACTSQGAIGDYAILHSGKDLRRGTDYLKISKVHKVHIRRGIETAQRPVHVDGRGLKRYVHALGQHYLHDVAGSGVFLNGFHRRLELLFSKFRDKVAFTHRMIGAAVLQALNRQSQCLFAIP